MKRYDEYGSVAELYEAFNIKPLSEFLTEADDKDNKADDVPEKANEVSEKTKKRYERDKKNTDDPTKVMKKDELEVVYAEYPEKYNNIFKHIIVFHRVITKLFNLLSVVMVVRFSFSK